jgi:hypothetical protein
MSDDQATAGAGGIAATVARASWPRRIDALWGYDVFIAHRRSDGASFAKTLFDALKAREVVGFVDTRVYLPGDLLSAETLRNASKSTIFVLVLSPDIDRPGAVDWVSEEIDAYLKSHPNNAKLLVIDFAGPRIPQDHPVRRKLAHFLYLTEPGSGLARTRC